MEDTEIYEEKRPWGFFRRFTNNQKSTVKILKVKPNEILSLQSHKLRSEFWRIINGSGFVQIGENKKEAQIGDEFTIALEEKHRLIAGDLGIEVLEIAIGNFEENDIIRYEDKYLRK